MIQPTVESGTRPGQSRDDPPEPAVPDDLPPTFTAFFDLFKHQMDYQRAREERFAREQQAAHELRESDRKRTDERFERVTDKLDTEVSRLSAAIEELRKEDVLLKLSEQGTSYRTDAALTKIENLSTEDKKALYGHVGKIVAALAVIITTALNVIVAPFLESLWPYVANALNSLFGFDK